METKSEVRDSIYGHRLRTAGVSVSRGIYCPVLLRAHCAYSYEAATGVLSPRFAINRREGPS